MELLLTGYAHANSPVDNANGSDTGTGTGRMKTQLQLKTQMMVNDNG